MTIRQRFRGLLDSTGDVTRALQLFSGQISFEEVEADDELQALVADLARNPKADLIAPTIARAVREALLQHGDDVLARVALRERSDPRENPKYSRLAQKEMAMLVRSALEKLLADEYVRWCGREPEAG